jgi:GH35 family endo-1,4-beta-xylanase
MRINAKTNTNMKISFNLFSKILKISTFSFLLWGCSNAKPIETPNPPDDGLGLKQINSKVILGSSFDLENTLPLYFETYKKELSAGQALWFPRWGDGWTAEGVYNFSTFNKRVNWLKSNNLSATATLLLGQDFFMPDWIINGNQSGEQLDMMMKNMIDSIMETNDNKNKVDSWLVVNELFEDDGTYRTNILWSKMGWEADSSNLVGDNRINDKHPLFIRKAFEYCRAKTNKKLEIRDFGIEHNNTDKDNYKKHRAIYQLLSHMKNTNIPVDVIGLQGHLIIGDTEWLCKNNAFKDIVAKYKALNLDVNITELDIRTNGKTWNDALAQKQKDDYYTFVKQAIEGGANKIDFWGIQDGADPEWFPTEQPLLWSKNLERKPAYFGVKQALMDTK